MFKESKLLYEVGNSPDENRGALDGAGSFGEDAEKEAKQQEEMAKEAEERRQIMAEAEQVLVQEPEVSNEYTELTSKAKKFEKSGGKILSESGKLFSGLDSSLDFDVQSRSSAVDAMISNFEIPSENSNPEGEKVAPSVNLETLKPEEADFSTPEGFMVAVSAVKAQDAKYKQDLSNIISEKGPEISALMEVFFKKLAVFNENKTAIIPEGDVSKSNLESIKAEVLKKIEETKVAIARVKRDFQNTTYVLESKVIEAAKNPDFLNFLNEKYKKGKEELGKARQQSHEERNRIEAKRAELTAQSEGLKEYRKKIKNARKKIDKGLSELSSVSGVSVDNSSKISDLDAKIAQIDQQLSKEGISDDEKTTLTQIRDDLIARKNLYSEQEASASSASTSVASSIAKMNEDKVKLDDIDTKVGDYVDNKIPAKLTEIDGLLSKFSELDVKMNQYNEYFEKEMRKTFDDISKTRGEVLTDFERNREQRDVSSFDWKLSPGKNLFRDENPFMAFEKGLDEMQSTMELTEIEDADIWDKTVGTALTQFTDALSWGIEGLSSISDLPGTIVESLGLPDWVHTGVDILLFPYQMGVGALQGAMGIAEGLLTVAKQPLQTLKGIGTLVGIGGDAGEAWGNLAKGLIYYDDWTWDVSDIGRAVGKIGLDVGLAVATAGSSAAISGGVKAVRAVSFLKGANKLRAVYMVPKAIAKGAAKDLWAFGKGAVGVPKYLAKGVVKGFKGFGKRIGSKLKSSKLGKFDDLPADVQIALKADDGVKFLEKEVSKLEKKSKKKKGLNEKEKLELERMKKEMEEVKKLKESKIDDLKNRKTELEQLVKDGADPLGANSGELVKIGKQIDFLEGKSANVGSVISATVSSTLTLPTDAIKTVAENAKKLILKSPKRAKKFAMSLLGKEKSEGLFRSGKIVSSDVNHLRKLEDDLEFLRSIPEKRLKPGVIDSLEDQIKLQREMVWKNKALEMDRINGARTKILEDLNAKDERLASDTLTDSERLKLESESVYLEYLDNELSKEFDMVSSLGNMEPKKLSELRSKIMSEQSKLDELNSQLAKAVESGNARLKGKLEKKIIKQEEVLGKTASELRVEFVKLDTEIQLRKTAKTDALSGGMPESYERMLDSEIRYLEEVRGGNSGTVESGVLKGSASEVDYSKSDTVKLENSAGRKAYFDRLLEEQNKARTRARRLSRTEIQELNQKYDGVLEEYVSNPSKTDKSDWKGYGHKVHLNVSPENVVAVSKYLKDNKYSHKFLSGGDVDSGKIFTVYFGSYDKASQWSEVLGRELKNLLDAPRAADEIAYADNIVGRFQGGEKDFSQYGFGVQGLSMDVQVKDIINWRQKRIPPEKIEMAFKSSYNKAAELYGEYFYGTERGVGTVERSMSQVDDLVALKTKRKEYEVAEKNLEEAKIKFEDNQISEKDFQIIEDEFTQKGVELALAEDRIKQVAKIEAGVKDVVVGAEVAPSVGSSLDLRPAFSQSRLSTKLFVSSDSPWQPISIEKMSIKKRNNKTSGLGENYVEVPLPKNVINEIYLNAKRYSQGFVEDLGTFRLSDTGSPIFVLNDGITLKEVQSYFQSCIVEKGKVYEVPIGRLYHDRFTIEVAPHLEFEVPISSDLYPVLKRAYDSGNPIKINITELSDGLPTKFEIVQAPVTLPDGSIIKYFDSRESLESALDKFVREKGDVQDAYLSTDVIFDNAFLAEFDLNWDRVFKLVDDSKVDATLSKIPSSDMAKIDNLIDISLVRSKGERYLKILKAAIFLTGVGGAGYFVLNRDY